MKKTVLSFLILFLFFPFTINAQTFLGFKTGLLTTPYIGYESTKYTNRKIDYQPSFTVSAIIKNQAAQHFTIGANISYDYYRADYKSSWYSPTGESGKSEANCRFGYLGLYFYPQLNFGKKLQFYFNAGPYFGVLTNSFVESVGTEANVRVDFMDNVVGLMSVIGLQYSINRKWQITLDVSGKRVQSTVRSSNFKNQSDVSLSFGFFYKIGNNSILSQQKTAPNN